MPARFTFVPNPTGLAELLDTPTGAVGRDLFRRGEILGVEAKRRAPVGVTGNLRKGLTVSVGGRRATLLADVAYARFVVSGTRAHLVSPRNGGVLRFVAGRGGYGAGDVVFTRRPVMIPAIPANRFALDALAVAMR